MQRISGLRSLVALQIFFFQPDSCSAALREIRFSVIDNILQCPELRVEYVAVCYSIHGPSSNSVTQLIRTRDGPSDERDKPTHAQMQPNPGSASASSMDVKGKEKSSDNATTLFPLSTTHSAFNLGEETVYTSDESDADWFAPDQFEESRVSVRDFLTLRDVVGIKMWEKEIWSLKL